MILDNNTSLKYIIILSTSIHRVARRGTVSRQTPVWQIPKVRAILIQCWPTSFDVGTPLIQHVLNVGHLPCSYDHQRPGTHSIDPVMAYHRASVADSGPTLKQHQVGVFSLLGIAAFPANTRR